MGQVADLISDKEDQGTEPGPLDTDQEKEVTIEMRDVTEVEEASGQSDNKEEALLGKVERRCMNTRGFLK